MLKRSDIKSAIDSVREMPKAGSAALKEAFEVISLLPKKPSSKEEADLSRTWDLDALNRACETLTRLWARVSADSRQKFEELLSSIVQSSDYDSKLRVRLENFKRGALKLYDEDDPIEALAAKHVESKSPESIKWLKENESMFPEDPPPVPEEVSL